VTGSLDLIESVSADFVCVVAVLTARDFSNALLTLGLTSPVSRS